MLSRFLCGTALLLACQNARAAEPASPDGAAESGVASSAPAALRGPLLLQVEGFDGPDEIERLRSALSGELGCLVLGSESESRFEPTGRVIVVRRGETRELAVTFVDGSGGNTTRVVEDPLDPVERTRLIALLVGTLARPPSEVVAPVAAPVVDEPTKPEPPKPEPPTPVATKSEPATHIATASFFYPLATNFGQPQVRSYFAFNLIYGRVGTLEGLELGTLQLASEGVQGAQIALIGNASGGRVEGFQAAFAVNSAAQLEGVQFAAVNHVAEESGGLQIGFLNYSGAQLVGAQAGLGVNVAEDVEGGQVGFVNVAQRVKGVQLGLVNVADEIDGVPVGLISVTKDGGVHPVVWYSNVTPFNAALKFATKYTYTFVNASWDPNASLVGPGGGIGGSIPTFLERLFVDVDASQTYLFRDEGPADDGRSLSRLRGTLRYQILPHLSVFAGGGYVGQVERRRNAAGVVGEYYYESLGEFAAGIGL